MSSVFNIWHINGLHQPLEFKHGYRVPHQAPPSRIWEMRGKSRNRLNNLKDLKDLKFRPVSPDEEEGEGSDEEICHKEITPVQALPDRVVAGHIMTAQVTTLSPDIKLSQAWHYFCKLRYRHIPVVNKEGVITGILSDRSVMKQALLYLKAKCARRMHRQPLVGQIMETGVVTATISTPVSYIASVFITKRIGSMPVCDAQGKVLGIITRSDLLRLIVKKGL